TRPAERPDARVASVLGRGAPPRALAAVLPRLRALALLPACRVPALLLRRPRVAARERTRTAAHVHRRAPRAAGIHAARAVRDRDRRARRGAAADDEPRRDRARSRPPPDRDGRRGRLRGRGARRRAAALPAG